MMKSYLKLLVLLSGIISFQTQSATIKANAMGFSSDEDDFWGVSFDKGTGFIKSVEFDLSTIPNSAIIFDFDPATELLDQLNITDLSGLIVDNISAAFSDINPSVLTLTFETGSFEANESFQFSADTDGTITILSQLRPEDHVGLLFTVMLENGTTVSDDFELILNTNFPVEGKSGVTLTIPSPIPVPAGIWLFLSGLLAIRYRGLKARKV